jgi:hypothetical protein
MREMGDESDELKRKLIEATDKDLEYQGKSAMLTR